MANDYLKVEMQETGVSVEGNGTLVDILHMLAAAALSIQDKTKLDDETFNAFIIAAIEAARDCHNKAIKIDLTNLIKSIGGE